jgi:hypothetical protein
MEGHSSTQPILRTGCAQPYVAIPVHANDKEWGNTTALVKEIILWISQSNLKIAGPLFYRYGIIDNAGKPFNLEVGFPVCTAVRGDERIIAGVIPDGTFATLVHCGNPDNIDESFNKLQNWVNRQQLKWKTCRQNGCEAWAGRFEFQLTDTSVQPNINQWRTAIAVLIA